MMFFYGRDKRRDYFEGWYLKQQNQRETVALIPAFHADGAGRASASLQVITGARSYKIDFPAESFHADGKKSFIRLGGSTFSEQGCSLDVRAPDCTMRGRLRFSGLTPPAGDIMGPFRFVPFLECRHSVFSLRHCVNGELNINGKPYRFENGSGYLEGDRGRSFPRRYLWTQCNWDGNSLMLSAAEIPYAGTSFTGCTGFLFLNGKEYRIATYCGAKLLSVGNDGISLRQKTLTLNIRLLEGHGSSLYAPQSGRMARTVRESISCRVHYSCLAEHGTLFDFISEQASFEDNWMERPN